MELVALKCPNCHANVETDDGLISYTCPYCQSRLELIHQDDGTIRVKLAMQAMKLEKSRQEFMSKEKDKEFQRELTRIKERRKDNFITALPFIGLFILLIIAWLIILRPNTTPSIKMIPVPYSSSDFGSMHWSTADKILEEAGFTNIKCIEADQKPGLFHADGEVYSISIDGKNLLNLGLFFGLIQQLSSCITKT